MSASRLAGRGDTSPATLADAVAQMRTQFGKGAARKIRRDHKIPAVMYGHGAEPVHITLPGHETMMVLKNANALLTIVIDGQEQLALATSFTRAERAPAAPVTKDASGRSFASAATMGVGQTLGWGSIASGSTAITASFVTDAAGALSARVNDAAANNGTIAIPGTWTGAKHEYRIDWPAGNAVFFIDGTGGHVSVLDWPVPAGDRVRPHDDGTRPHPGLGARGPVCRVDHLHLRCHRRRRLGRVGHARP